jgi:putative hydroxymethylpyrimidine transporter CytX
VQQGTPNWGIEPVPERLRVLGGLEQTMLWSNLGVSLLVLVLGALLVPALSLRDALVAVVVGSVVGNVMLGLAGMIGADARVPAMVLLRSPLGRRGSYLPTVLNVGQCLGWATFELIIIASAASALSDDVFGFRAKPAWTVFFGLAAAVLALMGPIGFVRRFLRRFAVYAVAASMAYLTYWVLWNADLGALWSAKGEGGMSIWLGVDLVIALTVSWVPLAADYTRFSRDRKGALIGSGLGYFIGATWILALGVVLVLDRNVTDATQVPVAVAAGGAAAALALLALTVDETDEAFANVYSTAVSLQNLVPRVPQRALILAVSTVSTVGALTVDLAHYLDFLYLLGSCFVPLFGVLLADWLVAGMRYRRDDFFSAPAVRPTFVAAWLSGFALYQWLQPVGPGWWTDIVQNAHPAQFSIGASLPSFALSFLVAALAGLAYKRPALAGLRS